MDSILSRSSLSLGEGWSANRVRGLGNSRLGQMPQYVTRGRAQRKRLHKGARAILTDAQVPLDLVILDASGAEGAVGIGMK
jgi:hypothetical protein